MLKSCGRLYSVLAVGDAARLVSEVVRRSGELSAYKAGLLHHSEYSHPPPPPGRPVAHGDKPGCLQGFIFTGVS